jgi:hypothetical protein
MTHQLHYYVGRDFCWFTAHRERHRVRLVMPPERVGEAWTFEIVTGRRKGERLAIPGNELLPWGRMATEHWEST